MGDIYVGKQLIAKDGQNVTEVQAVDPETNRPIIVSVRNHKVGERALVEVKDDMFAETRNPLPNGEETLVYISSVRHERS
jgi:hypothetical protein